MPRMVGYGNVGSSTAPFNMAAMQFPCVGAYIKKQHQIFSLLLAITAFQLLSGLL